MNLGFEYSQIIERNFMVEPTVVRALGRSVAHAFERGGNDLSDHAAAIANSNIGRSGLVRVGFVCLNCSGAMPLLLDGGKCFKEPLGVGVRDAFHVALCEI
ncbi:hypothetical protein P3T20_003998 [Paraburkholderia sp. GAS206C]